MSQCCFAASKALCWKFATSRVVSLSFNILIIMCSDRISLSLFTELECVVFIFHQIWGPFGHYFLQMFLLPLPIFPFWDLHNMYVYILMVSRRGSLFFNTLSFFSSQWIMSIILFSSLFILSSVCLYVLLSF